MQTKLVPVSGCLIDAATGQVLDAGEWLVHGDRALCHHGARSAQGLTEWAQPIHGWLFLARPKPGCN